MKVFIFDIARCNGCHNCQIACKDEHCDNDWRPIAAPQPDTGHFWLKVESIEHGQVPKVRMEYRPLMCNHCRNAPCIKTESACVYRRDDGLVIIDPEKSKGCRDIVQACPYGHIYYNEALDIPQKCTGCAHLVDEGGVPHCVDLCATEALRFGEEEEFADEIAQATCFTDTAHGSRVYYLNLPKYFAAGEVWDPQDDEVIIGAQVRLRLPDGSIQIQETDTFGDFWFIQLDPGDYQLDITAEGFEEVQRKFTLEQSENLRDFPLVRS